MAKPFSIQSPEEIAKEYGGNKQKIGEAMQMGIVDATAGVLAGMFIDRMRSAQMQEMAPQATVAQQVMGGLPPAPAQVPPAPQPGAPAGLGAIAPQGGEQMGMPQEAPMPMPEEAPMGMAMGGLAGLPVPDDMFDEPDTGGYAGGGIVAFSQGGPALGSWFEETALKAIPGIGVTSRQRSAAKNAQVGGVKNSYHMTDNARDFVPPEGMDMGSLAAKLKATFGAGYDVINEGDHVHVEPGSRSARTVTTPPREVDLSTAEGQRASLEDSLMVGRALTSGLPREELERAKAYAMEELDPANQEKERKADMWMALSQMGFRMASTQSPSLLQAIGEAATATLPEVEASKKERKAAKNEAVRTLMAIEDVDRKTALAGVEMGMEVYKSGLSQAELKQRMALANREISSREQIAKLDREAQLQIATARQANPSDFDTKLAIIMQANPGMNPLQALMYGQKQGFFGSSAQTGGWPGQQGGGAQPDNGGMSIIGSRPAQ